jgi:hypothetical protein
MVLQTCSCYYITYDGITNKFPEVLNVPVSKKDDYYLTFLSEVYDIRSGTFTIEVPAVEKVGAIVPKDNLGSLEADGIVVSNDKSDAGRSGISTIAVSGVMALGVYIYFN